MANRVLLALSGNEAIRRFATSAPGIKNVVGRFAAGETIDDAVDVCRDLIGSGMVVTLDHLGEDTVDRSQADDTCDAYVALLARLSDEGLTAGAEVSVKLSAIGQALGSDGPQISTDHAHRIAQAASAAGTTMTLDMEDHTTTDLTLATLKSVRADYPETGAVVQSQLRRTEADCRDLATDGSRIRLCKGAYAEPESEAYLEDADVDRSFVRCLRILLAGAGYPMIATHDQRLIEITEALVIRYGRARGTYEFQMLYGVRRDEQRRLTAEGEVMRVYVPYGDEWYGYLVRRMAERPANLALGVRAILGSQ